MRLSALAIALATCLALPACGFVWRGEGPAPLGAVTLVDPAIAPDAGRQQAFFQSYPDLLLTAAVAACRNPGQRPVQPGPGHVRCESLPTPEAAAGLILAYDGTVEALPLFIVAFSTERAEGGYVVTADNYISVPQRSGAIREVRLADAALEQNMRALLAAAGGEALAR